MCEFINNVLIWPHKLRRIEPTLASNGYAFTRQLSHGHIRPPLQVIQVVVRSLIFEPLFKIDVHTEIPWTKVGETKYIHLTWPVSFPRNVCRPSYLKSIRIRLYLLWPLAGRSWAWKEEKAKQCPFLHNDVISTLKLWVAEASCHCVLVSFRMSCLGGGKGGWGGCWKEDVTISHSFANEGRERSTGDLDTHKHHLLMILWTRPCKTGSLSQSSTWYRAGWSWLLGLVEEINHRQTWGNI